MMLRLAALPVAFVAARPGAGLAAASAVVAPEPYRFFSPDDAAFIEAAAERLIPADEHGPGARQTGVVIFIDRCLQGGWNSSERLYRNRIWQPGRQFDDYRLPATPGVLFRRARHGIEDDLAPRPELQRLAASPALRRRPARRLSGEKWRGTSVAATATAGIRPSGRLSARMLFARLSTADQDAYLRGLQTDARLLDGVPSWLFLEFLFTLTVEAFFGDPAISGNEDTVALNRSMPGAFEACCNPVQRLLSRSTS
jgi:gluconate 2-dehydrogenase gamma chain